MAITEALKQEKPYTVDDIYLLPDGERAELIDGKLYSMAPPTWTHQKISRKLHQAIANYIDSHNGNCEVLAAPFAVFLNNNKTNYVEPDISVICDRSKLDEKGCHGAPDWIIEIISESSRKMDYLIKLFKYRSAGVREYWIVDAEKKRVTVYFFEKDFIEEYGINDHVPVNLYNDFSIKIQ